MSERSDRIAKLKREDKAWADKWKGTVEVRSPTGKLEETRRHSGGKVSRTPASGFSGKVEEISDGKITRTDYLVGGERTARVDETKGTATVSKPSTLTFAKDQEEVIIKKQEISRRTNITPKQEFKGSISPKQQLSYAEQQEVARKEYLKQPWTVSAGKGSPIPINIWGTAGRTFGKIVAYAEPIANYPFGGKRSQKTKPGFFDTDIKNIELTAGNVAMFSAFSPAMTTTAQYNIALTPKEEVATFGGVSQKSQGGKIKTSLKYETPSKSYGSAKATTKILPGKGSVSSGYTELKGVTYKKQFDIPIRKQSYKGYQFSASKQTTPLTFEQQGIGNIITKKGSERFASIGYGIDTKQLTLSQGAIIKQGKPTYFQGFIAKIKGYATPPTSQFTVTQPSSTEFFSKVPSGSGQVSVMASPSAQSLASTSSKQIVTASFTPNVAVSKMGATAGSIVSSVKQTYSQKQSPSLIQVPSPGGIKQQYKTSIISATSPLTKTIQVPKGITKTGSRGTTIHVPKTSAIPSIKPIITPIQTTPQVPTKSPYTPTAPSTYTPRGSRWGGFIPPMLGASLGRIGMGRISTKPKYGYTPSYSAFAMGIKGRKTSPAFGGRYSGFEMRPITKDWMKNLGKGLTLKKKKKKGGII